MERDVLTKFIITLEQILSLMQAHDYEAALKIVQTELQAARLMLQAEDY